MFLRRMDFQGAIAKDQDEYPIAFNVSTTSQHQLLDCDPDIPQGQIDDAIIQGCAPLYKAHDFVQTPLCPIENSIFILPPARSVAGLGSEDVCEDTPYSLRQPNPARPQRSVFRR